jgi:hypothetical protein
MRFEEAQALTPGTLICIREEALHDDPENEGVSSLQDVAAKDGFIYRFDRLIEEEHFPIHTTSLATGKFMEFHPSEVTVVKKEQDDDLLS